MTDEVIELVESIKFSDLVTCIENNNTEQFKRGLEENRHLMNQTLREGQTLLILAAHFGNAEIVKYLINHNADLNVNTNCNEAKYDYDHETLLIFNLSDCYHGLPALFFAVRAWHVDVILLLIEAGVNIDFNIPQLYDHKISFFEFLNKKLNDKNTCPEEGKRVIDAIFQIHPTWILKEEGNSINRYYLNLLQRAVLKRNIAIVEHVLSKIPDFDIFEEKVLGNLSLIKLALNEENQKTIDAIIHAKISTQAEPEERLLDLFKHGAKAINFIYAHPEEGVKLLKSDRIHQLVVSETYKSFKGFLHLCNIPHLSYNLIAFLKAPENFDCKLDAANQIISFFSTAYKENRKAHLKYHSKWQTFLMGDGDTFGEKIVLAFFYKNGINVEKDEEKATALFESAFKTDPINYMNAQIAFAKYYTQQEDFDAANAHLNHAQEIAAHYADEGDDLLNVHANKILADLSEIRDTPLNTFNPDTFQ